MDFGGGRLTSVAFWDAFVAKYSTLGKMNVSVSPPTVTRGVTTSVTVSAKDTYPGAAIVGGQVSVGGATARPIQGLFVHAGGQSATADHWPVM